MYSRHAYRALSLLLLVSNVLYSASLSLVHTKGCFGCSVLSLDWFARGTNNYVTSGGEDLANNKQIHVALFDPLAGTVVNKATASFGDVHSIIHAVDEITIGGHTYIAAGGFTSNNHNQLIIYEFTGTKLINRASVTLKATINTVEWLTANGKYYLAVGDSDDGHELRIYQFDPSHHFDLDLLKDTVHNFYDGAVNSVDWLTSNGNYYLAAGGFETASIPNEIRIYQFNPVTGISALVVGTSFLGNTVNCVRWYVNEGTIYLATVGSDSVDSSQIRIFTFNPATSALTLVSSASFNSNNTAYAADWLNFGGTTYLAVGGDAGIPGNGVQVFTFASNVLTLAASATLADANVRTLEWDVINSNAYLAAGTTLVAPLRIFQLIII